MRYCPHKAGSMCGITVAFCLIYGYGFHHQYPHPLCSAKLFLLFLLCAGGLSFGFSFLMRLLKQHAGKQNAQEKETISEKTGKPGAHRALRNCAAFAVLLVGWIPYWLAAYPGFFTYDATNAFIQHFYGIEYSTHHPLIHSVLIADVFRIMLKFFPENYNAGIVALSWITMLMGAAVFVYMLDYIYERSNRWVFGAGLLYLTCFPTIGLFASCSTKDTFTAFWLLFFTIKLLKLYERSCEKNPRYQYGILVFFLVMMLLYRKNMLIAFVLFLPFFFLIVKNNRVRWAVIFATGLCGYFLCNGLLEHRYHPAHGAIGEMLCVPLQQMARVYVTEEDDMFTPQEKQLFDRIHPYSLSEYHELNADYVKHDMDDAVMRENLPGFFKMWIRIGIHHPVEYVEAFLANTYQAWYPFCNITGYADKLDSPYAYFKCDVEEPGELQSKLPEFYNFLWELCTETSLYEIPVIGILYTIGFYLIALCFTFFYGVYRKNESIKLFSAFLYTVTFTSMCGPLVLPRYYIYLFYMFPVMLAFIAGRESMGAARD